MSVRKETYLIYGLKFGEEFTEDYWQQDFRDRVEYFNYEDNGKIMFLTDGMNGRYTFFGQIMELGTRGDWYEDEIKKVDLHIDLSASSIIEKFKEYYPDSDVKIEDVSMYYVPHYV